MINNLINKRNNHIINNLEFNNIEEHRFDLADIINWVNIVSKQKLLINENLKILELGTKRSINANPTNKKSYFSHIKNLEYVMTDYQNGIDVDVVCDLHKTDNIFEKESFDLILSFSTFEHLKYPQLCSHNLMKMLKIGGRIFIQTHQTYPLHGYKYDYFRFSREALKSIFSKKMNFITITSYFTHDCVIIPHNTQIVWNDVAESYLNVVYIGEKCGKTPEEYIYDIDDVEN
jgi:2-polyprenyl-3-methyl-5-hydroxy-6-metoxy-1,4-benzoquinol methylase